MPEQPPLRIGTSSFSAEGWVGPFYPKGMQQRDFLSYYATRFDTVEIDSTFYRTPSVSTVKGWDAKTPPGFVFSAKVPQVITHEKLLHDCEAEFNEFVEVMDNLGDKLGPLLFQFAYFKERAPDGVNDFLARLRPFLKKLPRDHKFAVEIRNKNWLVPRFVEALRESGVALALIDQSWMPRPAQWMEKVDPVTAGFTYVRWLGDRKDIEAKTQVWNRAIVDRSSELQEWANVLGKLKVPIYAYANNHYAGYSPATVDMFRKLWGIREPRAIAPPRWAEQGHLFT